MTLDEFASRTPDDGDEPDALDTEIDIEALDQVSGGFQNMTAT